jgi:glycosyltransferase involved in cell wall biosynthesis
MAKVLLLLPASANYQTEIAARQLRKAAAPSLDIQVRTMGAGGDFPLPATAVINMRRGRLAGDVIHAFGENALTLAALGGAMSILYSPTEFPRPKSIRWLRSIMDFRDVQVICPTRTMHRAFVQGGVPIECCHLIPPGVDFSAVNTRRDAKLRAELGFGADDWVMLPVGESSRAADHPRAAWAACVLHVLDRRNRLLLWGRGPLAEQTERFVERLRQPGLYRVATHRLGRPPSFEQLASVADVGLLTPTSAVDTLPIAIAMAAMLPMIAIATPTVSELLEDRHNALLVGGNSARELATRLLDLRADDQIRKRICDQARAEAYENFSQSRFIQQYRSVYRQMAQGVRVEVPDPRAAASARLGVVS